MSNDNKIGRIDRRRKTPVNWIHVENEINKAYDGHVVYDHAQLEMESIRSAYENLNEADKVIIKGFVDKYDSNKYSRELRVHINNFGVSAVLETCAKLGIWLNAVGGE